MISSKTKYAIKALVVLAEESARGGGALTIEEIAERASVPKRFLEHILLEIKRAGLISSRRGRVGGYVLIKDARSISVGAILRLVDGPMAPLPCLSRRAYQRCPDCPSEATCRIRDVFGGVFAGYLLLIESLTLADLMQGESAESALAALADLPLAD
jgi:Rrf2 family protein